MRACCRLGSMALVCSVIAVPARAQLPPPPVVNPISIHVGGDYRLISPELGAHKAVEAMAKEKFLFAEIDKDGTAWGYNESALVRVFFMPNKGGVQFLAVVASRDKHESEPLSSAIRKHVADGELDPKAPKQIKHADGTRKPCDLKMRWSVEQRTTIPAVRFFVPAAAIVMEKQGLTTHHPGGTAVLGSNANTMMLAFAFAGPNEVSGQFGAVAISVDDKEGERLHNVVRSGIMKVLFE